MTCVICRSVRNRFRDLLVFTFVHVFFLFLCHFCGFSIQSKLLCAFIVSRILRCMFALLSPQRCWHNVLTLPSPSSSSTPLLVVWFLSASFVVHLLGENDDIFSTANERTTTIPNKNATETCNCARKKRDEKKKTDINGKWVKIRNEATENNIKKYANDKVTRKTNPKQPNRIEMKRKKLYLIHGQSIDIFIHLLQFFNRSDWHDFKVSWYWLNFIEIY